MFPIEQFHRAGPAADPVADPGKTRRDQLALDEDLIAVALGIGIGDDAALAVGGDFGATQDHLVAGSERGKGIPGRRTARRRSGLRRQRKLRHFDRGEADLAAVVKGERAAVADALDRAVRDLAGAARVRGILLLLCGCAKASARGSNKSRGNHCQNGIPPAHHRPV